MGGKWTSLKSAILSSHDGVLEGSHHPRHKSSKHILHCTHLFSTRELQRIEPRHELQSCYMATESSNAECCLYARMGVMQCSGFVMHWLRFAMSIHFFCVLFIRTLHMFMCMYGICSTTKMTWMEWDGMSPKENEEETMHECTLYTTCLHTQVYHMDKCHIGFFWILFNRTNRTYEQFLACKGLIHGAMDFKSWQLAGWRRDVPSYFHSCSRFNATIFSRHLGPDRKCQSGDSNRSCQTSINKQWSIRRVQVVMIWYLNGTSIRKPFGVYESSFDSNQFLYMYVTMPQKCSLSHLTGGQGDVRSIKWMILCWDYLTWIIPIVSG